jgi:hypothetical protein
MNTTDLQNSFKNVLGYIVALVILWFGLIVPNKDSINPNISVPKFQVSQEDDAVKASLLTVKKEYEKIQNPEDKLIIYKMFAGAGDYLSVAKTLGSNVEFNSLFANTLVTYGWEKEKYPTFTDAISSYLKSVNYHIPKKITSKQDIENLGQVFKSIEEVLK